MEKIGWIGTGKLGTAIVRRLLTQNVPVMIFNRTYEKAQALVEDGATFASSPCDIAQECTIVFLCLTGQEAIEDVIFDGERGIVAAGTKPSGPALPSGPVRPSGPARRLRSIIDTSTVSPSFAISLAGRLREIGIDYLEAPVSGGPENARLGKLACIMSGSQVMVEKHRELMAKFTASLHYVGESGSAQLIKVLNNLAESINLLGAAEVLAIGLGAGLDLETLHTVLPTMRGYSTYMGVLLDRLVNPREDVSFAVGTRLKDLKLAHQVAGDHATATPMGALAEQLFTLLLQQEGPLADQTACVRLYNREEGTK
jgi:3-hydroxyisobutyrate dehydrogenase-like beta-hydroxyacid dehydrogenase